MDKYLKYSGDDKMSDLISENYSLLLVMSRFGLSFGFGDGTVEQVCREQGVHTGTFLAVVNFMDEEWCVPKEYYKNISVPALMDYLRQAHSYFLDFNLPAIRRRLIDAIDCSQDKVAFLIMKFFDEYVNEVRAHMEYENQVVFKYVNSLLDGGATGNYSIKVFAARHNQIETKLTELKNIIVKYYPAKANNNLLNSVLFDIYTCEKDLCLHCRVEDYIFVPLIKELENETQGDGRR
ncbi:MAG: hemerythrin domain-containing protein [Odoribacter sp.]|nr:hemerythrin domain-containing protein [Odoribacter sp.]